MVSRLTPTFFRPCCQRMRDIDRPLACRVRTYCDDSTSSSDAAQLPRHLGHAVGRDRDPRQQRVPDRLDRRDAEGFRAGRRQPVQLQRDLRDQDHRQPEAGHGDAERGDHADHLVDPAVGLDRGDHAHRDAGHQRQHQRDRRRSSSVLGKARPMEVGDLLAGQQRLREIALRGIGRATRRIAPGTAGRGRRAS